jgi:hypothetical protein
LRGPRAGGCKKSKKWPLAPINTRARGGAPLNPRRGPGPHLRTRGASRPPRASQQPGAVGGGRWAVGGGGARRPFPSPGPARSLPPPPAPAPPPPGRAPHPRHRADQLRDHTGKKRRYWLVLKEISNTRRPLFFFCVCWHGASKQHFRSKKFAPRRWWSCSETASGSRATHGGTFHPHL